MLRYGPFELVRRLAVGGMAEIFLGRHVETGDACVLKRTLPHLAAVPEVAERLPAEARVLARLFHPNIVATRGLVAGEPPALVLEHVAGLDLAAAARRSHALGLPIPAAAVDAICAGLRAALAHVHAAGLTHRDVKASNVLLGADGAIKLADFGIAAPGDPAVDQRALAELLGRLAAAAAPEGAWPEWLGRLLPAEPPEDAPADTTLPILYQKRPGAPK